VIPYQPPAPKVVVRRVAVFDKEFVITKPIRHVLKAGYTIKLSKVSPPIARVEKNGDLYISFGHGIICNVPSEYFHLEEEQEVTTVTVTRRRINADEIS